jgi:hypothetical protein
MRLAGAMCWDGYRGLAAGRGRSGSGRLARSAHADKAVVGRLRERLDQAQISAGAWAFDLNIVPMACMFAVRVAQSMVRNDRQGNCISKEREEFDEIILIPGGFFEFSA